MLSRLRHSTPRRHRWTLRRTAGSTWRARCRSTWIVGPPAAAHRPLFEPDPASTPPPPASTSAASRSAPPSQPCHTPAPSATPPHVASVPLDQHQPPDPSPMLHADHAPSSSPDHQIKRGSTPLRTRPDDRARGLVFSVRDCGSALLRRCVWWMVPDGFGLTHDLSVATLTCGRYVARRRQGPRACRPKPAGASAHHRLRRDLICSGDPDIGD